jgi:hypothetical protein
MKAAAAAGLRGCWARCGGRGGAQIEGYDVEMGCNEGRGGVDSLDGRSKNGRDLAEGPDGGASNDR